MNINFYFIFRNFNMLQPSIQNLCLYNGNNAKVYLKNNE